MHQKLSCYSIANVFVFILQLPYLIDGDFKITQSNAVSIYWPFDTLIIDQLQLQKSVFSARSLFSAISAMKYVCVQ